MSTAISIPNGLSGKVFLRKNRSTHTICTSLISRRQTRNHSKEKQEE